MRPVAYWTCTQLVAFENAAGAMWTFLPVIPGINRLHAAWVFAEYLGFMLAHLGYPQYFKYILGPWQLACAAALLAPRLPRVVMGLRRRVLQLFARVRFAPLCRRWA